METEMRSVRVRREASGWLARCNCGFESTGLAGPGAGVTELIAHVRAEHPGFVATFMASIAPPMEYCPDPVPVAAFVSMMERMWGSALAPRRRAPRGAR